MLTRAYFLIFRSTDGIEVSLFAPVVARRGLCVGHGGREDHRNAADEESAGARAVFRSSVCRSQIAVFFSFGWSALKMDMRAMCEPPARSTVVVGEYVAQRVDRFHDPLIQSGRLPLISAECVGGSHAHAPASEVASHGSWEAHQNPPLSRGPPAVAERPRGGGVLSALAREVG